MFAYQMTTQTVSAFTYAVIIEFYNQATSFICTVISVLSLKTISEVHVNVLTVSYLTVISNTEDKANKLAPRRQRAR